MKTLFLKNVMPFAVVAFGIAGAFVTTSMQSSSTNTLPKYGYVRNPQGICNIRVNCDTQQGPVCRLNGDTGPQAFGKPTPESNCTELMYRPAN